MAHDVPSFLGSNERSASQFSEQKSLKNRLLEVREDKNLQEDEIENNALSSHRGENSPSRSQVSSPRRTHKHHKDPESDSSRNLEDDLALTHVPFATISIVRKRKAHHEVFEAFTGWPRGNDPNHVTLGDAGIAMAKRVLHPQEAERWPFAEAYAFMKKYLTLIQDQKMRLESDLYWPAPPDNPQGIRVASVFEFSVCLCVCVFICSGQIF